MTREDIARDSYGSYCLAIRAWREIRVRSGQYEPRDDSERRWASEGPRLPMALDSVLSPSTDTGG